MVVRGKRKKLCRVGTCDTNSHQKSPTGRTVGNCACWEHGPLGPGVLAVTGSVHFAWQPHRSFPDLQTYIVSSLNKLAMFHTYTVVTTISPSVGSLEGGTILTTDDHFFDQTDYPATVLVGGLNFKILSFSDNRIKCGRGVKLEMWNNSSPAQLDDVLAYNESRACYFIQWVDSLTYTWPSHHKSNKST
ncbi:fibrocystin-L [Arapaima gigas]